MKRTRGGGDCWHLWCTLSGEEKHNFRLSCCCAVLLLLDKRVPRLLSIWRMTMASPSKRSTTFWVMLQDSFLFITSREKQESIS